VGISVVKERRKIFLKSGFLFRKILSALDNAEIFGTIIIKGLVEAVFFNKPLTNCF
jgi:hypothetical protein